MEWIDRDMLRLSSGRLLKPNGGIVGIAHDFERGEPVVVHGGYDDTFLTAPYPWDEDDPLEPPWTVEEKQELAELMIAVWKRFGGIE